MEQLSSRWTFVMKFIFPTVWLAGFLSANLAVWTGGGFDWGLLIATLAGLALFWHLLFRLKRVVAREDGLVVSNFLRDERIAYSDIASVSEWRWWRPRLIDVRLKRASSFGTRILFCLYAPLMIGVSEDHPVTRLLRERAGAPDNTTVA